ncbi:MAG: site-specific DNA-methyltransferase [Solirubrobacterales bacterium]|nr:site-specific DNA-methyltransferase [Solirubrobacterales bacterium]OJU93390.1 MAG: hypothetical protein BGO23_12025 [Solirubrobacterales bacterium 67-14]
MNPTTSKVIRGDCIEEMNRMNPESIDAVVTDPPYAIARFRQGDETWDAQAIRNQAMHATRGDLSLGEGFERWCQRWATSCHRVVKPGAHLLVFGSSRTFHRLVAGVEDAGFQIRDVLMWLYSSGMPKSRRLPGDRATALKPAYEPILLARRPLDTTAEEAASHGGVGTLDVGSCRTHGRHPANVLFSHSPDCSTGRCDGNCPVSRVEAGGYERRAGTRLPLDRVFYCSKASRRERDAGCESLPAHKLNLFPRAGRRPGGEPRPVRNHHPTVKPVEVMRWLVRLSCPEEGILLDPFCGSGTTGIAAALEARAFVGIEKDASFAAVATARIEHVTESRPAETQGSLEA